MERGGTESFELTLFLPCRYLSPLASLLSSTVPPPLLDIDATPVTLPPRPPPSFRLAYAEACAKDNLTPDAHPGSRVSFSHPSFPEPWRYVATWREVLEWEWMGGREQRLFTAFTGTFF